MSASEFSRRAFVLGAGTVLGAAVPGISALAPTVSPAATSFGADRDSHSGACAQFVQVLRRPDSVHLVDGSGSQELKAAGGGRWQGPGCEVFTQEGPGGITVWLAAPNVSVKQIQLRWNGRVPAGEKVLGDAWERAYGDLGWASLDPQRVLPWYFAVTDGTRTGAYGVRTGPAALCYWNLDQDGASLWADVRSGGVPLELGSRTLQVCTVVAQDNNDGETPFDTLRALCRRMCARPRLSSAPIYGHNDWDYYYGHQSAQTTLDVTALTVAASPEGADRPFIVIDDGWEGDGDGPVTGGPWDHGNPKFPDMPGLASNIVELGGKPGLWMRPTSAWAALPDAWKLQNRSTVLDPTVPDALHQIETDISRVSGWGYQLLKHDFSTFDLMGRWGNQMGSQITDEGWGFREGAQRTTAEVVLDLYRTIRSAGEKMNIIACNTFSHLSAGIFEAMRIGDDTSGTDWNRTRTMGVNSLGFRIVQNGTFYATDPDIAPITSGLSWEHAKEWLELVGSSSAVLFTSIDPSVYGAEQQAALKDAFAKAASGAPLGRPLDWMSTPLPAHWLLEGTEHVYNWT